MGSLIARCLIAEYDGMGSVILCGTAQERGLKTRMGCFLASCTKLLKGNTCRSPFLANNTTGYKSFAKISNRTTFDWLTRDNNVVGLYINDPYCGFMCTASFYYDLIKLTSLASSAKYIKRPRRDLPILVISGLDDPVGGYGKGVSKYFSMLQRYGFVNSSCIIYDECRHELLNELNRKEVMNDILNWLEAPEEPDAAGQTGSEDLR